MAVAVSEEGGLGSFPCAMFDAEGVLENITQIQAVTSKPLNVNFFCHEPKSTSREEQDIWRGALGKYYQEYGIEPDPNASAPQRAPFNSDMCAVIEERKPQVVSFHFGLPDDELVGRVKATGARVLSSATSVEEAIWLEQKGCDAIIAQGYEAGGHRGIFLSDDISTQSGLFSLLPQVVDAVKVPVIATGGIADGRGIAAAFALGASAAQIGTAFLFTPEAIISSIHRKALSEGKDNGTALTNVFTGRPARGLLNRVIEEVGPISKAAPVFPTAGGALALLKAKAEESDKGDFSSLWSGQSASLCREMGSAELLNLLWQEAQSVLKT